MNSRTTSQFRRLLARLPQEIQQQTQEAYRLFVRDPNHPGLRFKRVSQRGPVYSVRITRGYRALGVLENGTIIWFWIGTHADYDRLLSQL